MDELQQVLEKLGAKEFVPPGVFRVVGYKMGPKNQI